MRPYPILVLSLLLFMTSCMNEARPGRVLTHLSSGNSEPEQETKKVEKKKTTEEPKPDVDPEEEAKDEPEPKMDPVPLPVPEVPKEIGPEKGECKEKLDYDPTAIGCAFPENTSNSVWRNEGPWLALINMMSNKAAAWMAPSTAMKKGAGMDYCPSMVGTNKLVYVTHFKLEEATKVIVEAIMDDEGVIEIWKNADSKQKVYSTTKASNINTEEANLEKGFYSLIISTTDNGASATAFLGSIVKADTKEVIKQTEGKGWCIFKMQKEVGTEDFLNSHSLCMECMIGDAASK